MSALLWPCTMCLGGRLTFPFRIAQVLNSKSKTLQSFRLWKIAQCPYGPWQLSSSFAPASEMVAFFCLRDMDCRVVRGANATPASPGDATDGGEAAAAHSERRFKESQCQP